MLVSPLQMRSAYRAASGADPPYTSSVSQGMKTVDYVLYTPEPLPCDTARPGDSGAAALRHRAVATPSSPGVDRCAVPAAGGGEAAAAQRDSPRPGGAGGAGGGGPVTQGGCGGAGARGGAWRLWPQAVLMPPPEGMAQHGMPTADLPSDHVSLVVRFALSRGGP